MLLHLRLRLSTARAYPFGMFVSIDRQHKEKMKRSSKRELGIDAGCGIILIHFAYLIGFCNILRTQIFEDNWAKLVFADALNICESSTVRQAVSLLCLFKIFKTFHKNYAMWT